MLPPCGNAKKHRISAICFASYISVTTKISEGMTKRLKQYPNALVKITFIHGTLFTYWG